MDFYFPKRQNIFFLKHNMRDLSNAHENCQLLQVAQQKMLNIKPFKQIIFHIYVLSTEMKERNGWCLNLETQWRLNHEREVTEFYTDSCPAGTIIIILDWRQKAKHSTELL